MKKIILAALLALPGMAGAQGAYGEVIGRVVDSDSMSIFSATVFTESNGIIYRDVTDAKGKFRISAIPAGKYKFSVVYEKDTMANISGEISMDGIENLQTIVFNPKGAVLDVVNIVYDREQIHLKYGVAPEIKMNAEQIKQSPLKFDQKAMIASMTSDVKVTEDGELVFRGARKGDMIYMMDGVKVRNVSNVPSASIGGMMVYTGGIPAKYGDTTGGVVVMETKSYFDLYREWRMTQH